SKRCSSSSVSGSTIANSSSRPTVKSVEDSKVSRARSRSSADMPEPYETALGQVEVERVEEVDGRAGSVDRHLRRHLEQLLGVVEDDLHPGLDEAVGDALGGVGRHREHADDDLLLGDDRLELGEVTHLEAAGLLANDPRLDVEHGDNLEAVVGEDVGAGDRLA